MTPVSPASDLNPAEVGPVFVVEDDADVARIVCHSLKEFGFRTEHFPTGRELLNRIRRAEPVVCIVDLQLPDIDGMHLVRVLQEEHGCGILILTGRVDVTDRVLGLESGADDYLAKPFEPRELVARVRSIVRRSMLAATGGRERDPVARFAGWTFDTERQSLTAADGREIPLSGTEARLLRILLESPNRILTREQLMKEREIAAYDRSIDVRVSKLRRKIEADPHNPRLIKTVYGGGYLMSTTVEWVPRREVAPPRTN